MATSQQRIAVYFETVPRRTFACAVHWPGWCRSGKDEERALAALAAAAPRYAVVAAAADVAFPADDLTFEVVERLPGTATTDFGAPGVVRDADSAELTQQEAQRQAALLVAAWSRWEEIVAAAPASLRKGPRGGGRDRDAVVDHVLGAEVSYARQLGVRHRQPDRDDADAIAAFRHQLRDTLAAARPGAPPGGKGWPSRYAARRIIWHVLDHAWEIEDRSEPAGT